MRLKQGSYYYILGVMAMFLSGVAAATSIILGVRYQEDLPFHNDLLSDYGSVLAGHTVILWMIGIFGFFALSFATYIFFTALKKNDLVTPFRLLGIGMLVFATSITVLLILQDGRYGTLYDVVGRYLHIPPVAALGVCLVLMSMGRKNTRMPTIFFAAMCGYAAFAGLGFEKLFTRDLVQITDAALRGYSSLFLFSLSLALFFAGICLCVGSCERRKGKSKKFEYAEE